MRFEPGVSVEYGAARFGLGTIAIRGLEGNRVQMLEDGIRLPDGYRIGSFSNASRNPFSTALVSKIEVLRGYAEKFHARPATWVFLTGPQDAVEDAVVRGFKVAVGREKDDTVDGFAIVHGTKFVLVDGKRQIRGYYDSNDAEAQAALRRDLSTLADESH